MWRAGCGTRRVCVPWRWCVVWVNSEARGDVGSRLEGAASPFTHLSLKGFPNEICPLLKPEGDEGEAWGEERAGG